MPFCISPQIIFDAVINDGLSIAYYRSLYPFKKHGWDRLNTSVACACIILDMAGHSRNTETNKIERKN